MSGALLNMQCKPAFARHETFHLRFGWLRKGYDAVLTDPKIFSDPVATVKLGVGKNMVNAIRYWCEAYSIIEKFEPDGGSRVPHYTPTAFGESLLGASGWDPWLEDSASLWLLHWHLLRAQSIAPVWWVAFNLFGPEQFEEHQLTNLVAELSEAAGWRAVQESSIKKDVDCLVRSFAMRRTGRQTMDDVLDCPTRQLGLIAPAVGESKSWRFVTGPKSSLPAEIVLYACLDYVAINGVGQSSISVARLASDPGAPGRAFRLSEADLWDLLQLASERCDDVTTAEPSGIRQLVVNGVPTELRDDIVVRYFAPGEAQAA